MGRELNWTEWTRLEASFLGCIKCLRCLSVSLSVRQSVCLSRGSTRLHCAKAAERIKVLSGKKTLGAHETLLCWGPDPPHRGGGDLLLNFRTPRISGTTGATWPTFNFWNRLQISGTATASESSVCSVCSAFDAAFAKLLWPLVLNISTRM